MWLIVGRLTISGTFSIHVGQSTEVLVEKYMHEVERLHDVPDSIVLD